MQRVVALAFGYLAVWSSAALAAPVLIQPVVVCDSLGFECAGGDPNTPGSIFSQFFSQTVLDTIYAQTATADANGLVYDGASFLVLPATYLSNSLYLDPQLDVAGNPIDQAHQLLRLPNNAASRSPTTLNVYLVDQIVPTLNGIPVAGSTVHGYGLTSSNGAILDTGAHIDSVAHEVGHNLGLGHVDVLNPDGTEAPPSAQSNANNLLQSQFRMTPVSVTDPAIATSIDLLSGTVANDQIAQANQPLFTVDLASATLGASVQHPEWKYCSPGNINCSLYISSYSADSTESLIEVKIRWLDGHALDDVGIDPLLHGIYGWSQFTDAIGCDNVGLNRVPLGGSGIELDVSFQPGCLTPGQESSIFFSYSNNPDLSSGSYQIPFSVEWDFTDGRTSNALFDATGNAASPDKFRVGAIDRSKLGDEAFIEFEPTLTVPEPASAALLLGALFAAFRRRRAPSAPC